MPKLTKAQLKEKTCDYLKKREQAMALFRDSGDLFKEIVAATRAGQTIDCGRLGRYRMVDKFKRKTVCFKNVGFDRYEFEPDD